jgi:hypothetical protein
MEQWAVATTTVRGDAAATARECECERCCARYAQEWSINCHFGAHKGRKVTARWQSDKFYSAPDNQPNDFRYFKDFFTRSWCYLRGDGLTLALMPKRIDKWLAAVTIPAAFAGFASIGPVTFRAIPPPANSHLPMTRIAPYPHNLRDESRTALSPNWSGYTAFGGRYTSVSASWVEPAGRCAPGYRYASFWVGLDGFTSHTVEQAGTQINCARRRPTYYSWYEFFPAPQIRLRGTTRPGDRVTVWVGYAGRSRFTLVVANATRRWQRTVHGVIRGAARSSAEAIIEAPCCTRAGKILPLADFRAIRFSGIRVDRAPIGRFRVIRIVIATTRGQHEDQVSWLARELAFTATWLRVR